MKRLSWQVRLSLVLVALSALLYLLHYAIFRDSHHIFIYMLGGLAFVPLNVLLVTVIIHRLLAVREKRAILRKLNMVIGTFFGEMGTDLLASLARFDANAESIQEALVVSKDWTDDMFRHVSARLKSHQPKMDIRRGDTEKLRTFLLGKRGFMLSLLQNPALLEHETFTDVLWAVFHLTDELAHRKDLGALPDSDYRHLVGDIDRAYRRLVGRWIAYMQHLKGDYPYLFSLALRTNPFDPTARPEVT